MFHMNIVNFKIIHGAIDFILKSYKDLWMNFKKRMD
jgi:hypothetical protein